MEHRKSGRRKLGHRREDFPVNRRFIEAVLLALGMMMLGLLATFFMRNGDTLRDGYLPKSDYGSSAYREALDVDYRGERRHVTVEIVPMRYTDAEVAGFLDAVEDNLTSWITDGGTADHVDKDLNLYERYGDYPVDISWVSYAPQLVTYDGKLSDEVPDSGVCVRLEATLACQDDVRTVDVPLTVFPKKLTEAEAFQKAIDRAVREQETEDRLLLPTTVDGESVSWSRSASRTTLVCLLLGAAVGILYWYAGKRRYDEDEKAFHDGMMKDYPALINKIILLLGAGLSMRRVFAVIADDYEKILGATGRVRPGFGLVAEACGEMEKGISESEAYFQLGRKSTLASYRTLSVLLLQNQKRGSGELLTVFQREAEAAFEERRKAARLEGEKASSKLLFPMMIMLCIIFLIVMIPAYLAF